MADTGNRHRDWDDWDEALIRDAANAAGAETPDLDDWPEQVDGMMRTLIDERTQLGQAAQNWCKRARRAERNLALIPIAFGVGVIIGVVFIICTAAR